MMECVEMSGTDAWGDWSRLNRSGRLVLLVQQGAAKSPRCWRRARNRRFLERGAALSWSCGCVCRPRTKPCPALDPSWSPREPRHPAEWRNPMCFVYCTCPWRHLMKVDLSTKLGPVVELHCRPRPRASSARWFRTQVRCGAAAARLENAVMEGSMSCVAAKRKSLFLRGISCRSWRLQREPGSWLALCVDLRGAGKRWS